MLLFSINFIFCIDFYFRFIYALNGVNGTVLPDWPVSVGARMTANVLITRVSTAHTTPDMVGQLFYNPVIQNLSFLN